MVSLLLALAACREEPIPEMEPSELLIRASLDLRGVRPSKDEFERLEAHPEDLDPLIDDMLGDDRFGPRVRELWAEIYLTRTETYFVNAAQYRDPEVTQQDLIEAVGDEPLRVLQHVAEEDLPYTELVTGDWTMANDTLGRIWPLDYPEGGTGWQVAHYTDGRPAAGVLATNGMWWRYTSTDSNANRKRGNAVSRIFLCHDYLVRPIDFDRNVNLLDEQAVLDALQENPGCINCHVSLDPLASYLYGFYYVDAGSVNDASIYHPEREMMWEDRTGVPPAYFGSPGYTLRDLGVSIASDPRFPECAVEQAWELLLRREKTVADTDRLVEIREAFLQDDLTVRSLLKAVVHSPEYRAGATDAEGYVPEKMATPQLLASQIEDLTGFRYTLGGYDLLQSDMIGFLTLAGGADGYYVTKSADLPNATSLLVQERLAQAAAAYVAREDAINRDDPKLFTEVDFTETPDTDRDAMVAQIQALHFRLFGTRVEANGEEVEANLELWEALYAVEPDPVDAWAGVLQALLRDPDFLFY